MKEGEGEWIKYEIERKKEKETYGKKYGIHLFIPSSLNPSIHPSICLLAQKSATKVWYIEVIKNTEHGMSK